MTLPRYQFSVLDAAGNVVPGAHVEVRREVPGQPLAQLYSEINGATTIGSPIDADANGFVFFHIAVGTYQIRVYTGPSGAPTFEHIRRYVPISFIRDETPRTEADSGDVVLLASDRIVILQPGTPEPRTVTIPADLIGDIDVWDGNRSWATANVTFEFDGGTINGKAQWLGRLSGGHFKFAPNPNAPTDLMVSGIG